MHLTKQGSFWRFKKSNNALSNRILSNRSVGIIHIFQIMPRILPYLIMSSNWIFTIQNSDSSNSFWILHITDCVGSNMKLKQKCYNCHTIHSGPNVLEHITSHSNPGFSDTTTINHNKILSRCGIRQWVLFGIWYNNGATCHNHTTWRHLFFFLTLPSPQTAHIDGLVTKVYTDVNWPPKLPNAWLRMVQRASSLLTNCLVVPHVPFALLVKHDF